MKRSLTKDEIDHLNELVTCGQELVDALEADSIEDWVNEADASSLFNSVRQQTRHIVEASKAILKDGTLTEVTDEST